MQRELNELLPLKSSDNPPTKQIELLEERLDHLRSALKSCDGCNKEMDVLNRSLHSFK